MDITTFDRIACGFEALLAFGIIVWMIHQVFFKKVGK